MWFRPSSVVIDAAFRSFGVQVAMHLEGGGVFVFPRMVVLIRHEPLELSGVVTHLGLISAGLRFCQFLAVFGDVGLN